MLIVVSWSAGARIETTRRALGWFAATYLLYVGLSVPNPTQPLSAVQTLVFITLSFLVTAVVPALASRNRAQRRTLISALHEHNAQLLREREIIASHARLRERQRIAQDMHDSLGHQLALIAVHTGALEVDRDLTGGQREVVGVLREASVSAMHELREAVGILRDGTPINSGTTRASWSHSPEAWQASTGWWRRPGARGRSWRYGVRGGRVHWLRPPTTRRSGSSRRR